MSTSWRRWLAGEVLLPEATNNLVVQLEVGEPASAGDDVAGVLLVLVVDAELLVPCPADHHRVAEVDAERLFRSPELLEGNPPVVVVLRPRLVDLHLYPHG